MKKILTLLAIALLTATAAWARVTPGEKVGVKFDTLTYDFGIIDADSAPVTHEFTYTVTGDEPVAILSAKANCGCTTPKYDREPSKPGKKGVIKVSFVPKGQQPGGITKEVRVRMKNGAGKSENLTLRFVGTIRKKGK